MAKKNFLLLSLDDSETKKIANIVGNNSSRKILDFLADKDSATESELSKTLDLPISTVHYNMQHLKKAGLVSADEYHYSEKGKEILHYKLANKYIIITPKKVTGIKEKLRSILPVALVSVVAAALIKIFSKDSLLFATKTAAPQLLQAAEEQAVARTADTAGVMMQEAPNAAATKAAQATTYIAEPTLIQTLISQPAFWFIAGSLFAILIYIFIALVKKE